MARPVSAQPTTPAAAFGVHPLLPVLFFGSGCAALIYEIVWFQLIQLVIGSSAISLGVLLGTFMGGMCLGSLLLPRLISTRAHPFRVFALLEIGIGMFGVAVLLGLPPLGNIYASIASPGLMSVVLRGAFCAACLLVPTMFMGASLPAFARWVEATPRGVSWLGLFYGSNIAGAVLGCLLAGFYLLRVYDMAVATWVAAAINLLVGVASLVVAVRSPWAARAAAPPVTSRPRESRPVYLAIALSGMTALGAEVIWTRLMSVMLGATVYTFSLILAVVLVGLGFGSTVGSWLARSTPRPRVLLGWCQLLIAVAIAWTAYMIAQSLPYWPVNPLLSTSPWIYFQFDLIRCAWALLPATLLWGASFPLAIAAVAAPGQDTGQLVGRVYAANTIGAIIGAVGFSVLGIPALGTQNAQRLLIAISVVSGLIVLALGFARTARPALAARGASSRATIGLAVVAALVLGVAVKPVPAGLIGYGPYLAMHLLLPDAGVVSAHIGSSMVTVATVLAVAINVAVAAAALAVATRSRWATAMTTDTDHAVSPQATQLLYVMVALSGMSAVGFDVLRMQPLWSLLGESGLAVSMTLGTVLVGLLLGAMFGGYLARVVRRPRLALGVCQLLLPLAIGWTGYLMAQSLPHWPVNPLLSLAPSLELQFDAMAALAVLLPPTLLWGVSIALAVAVAASTGHAARQATRRVFFASAAGAIAGAVVFGVIAVPAIGNLDAQRLLIALAVVAGLLILLPMLRSRSDGMSSASASVVTQGAVVAVALAVLIGLSAAAVPPGPIASGKWPGSHVALPTFLFAGEGMNSSIAVSEEPNGNRAFHVSGKVEASSAPDDMRLQRLLGHLAGQVQGDPKSVLIVGFGAGVTAGTFVLYPGITRIVICELEPLIPRSVGPFFVNENYDVLHDPRVEVVYDDARDFIRTTKEKFDVITSDPIHPWVRGAATLYTEEYFTLVRQHLNPGGVVTQWIPLYESHKDAVKSEIASFLKVFPGGTIWANYKNHQGYDLVVLGRAEASRIDIDAMDARWKEAANAPIVESLRNVGIFSLFDLFGSYVGNGSDLEPWLRDAEINRDRSLRLQYIAGLGSNANEGQQILAEMLGFRTFPEDLFRASDQWKDQLSTYMQSPRTTAR